MAICRRKDKGIFGECLIFKIINTNGSFQGIYEVFFTLIPVVGLKMDPTLGFQVVQIPALGV